jgi:hypothetical protein
MGKGVAHAASGWFGRCGPRGGVGRGAVWAAGLCGCCGERRLVLGTAPAGESAARGGNDGGLPARSESTVRALEARKELGFCCIGNVAVGFDILGLLGAMFVCRRRPHKIRLLLVHRHFSGALRCFGHALVSFRSRTCSFRTLLAQACTLMLFHVVQTWRVMSGMAELGIAQALCAFGC